MALADASSQSGLAAPGGRHEAGWGWVYLRDRVCTSSSTRCYCHGHLDAPLRYVIGLKVGVLGYFQAGAVEIKFDITELEAGLFEELIMLEELTIDHDNLHFDSVAMRVVLFWKILRSFGGGTRKLRWLAMGVDNEEYI